jgi:hypothetical protein
MVWVPWPRTPPGVAVKTHMTELHDTAVSRRHSSVQDAQHLVRCSTVRVELGRADREGPMSASDNETFVRRAIEAIWNHGDLDVADELFAPSYVNHDGVITDLVLGPEAIKISAALHRLAFPDLRVTIEALRADDDIVVIHWTARRGATDNPGGDVTMNQLLLTGITRTRWTGSKIVESWTGCDRPPPVPD